MAIKARLQTPTSIAVADALKHGGRLRVTLDPDHQNLVAEIPTAFIESPPGVDDDVDPLATGETDASDDR